MVPGPGSYQNPAKIWKYICQLISDPNANNNKERTPKEQGNPKFDTQSGLQPINHAEKEVQYFPSTLGAEGVERQELGALAGLPGRRVIASGVVTKG